MNKDLFLTQLREALQGNVSQGVINENISYYENYILQELRKGKTEEEIFSTLGNPRILAQTIIDTSGGTERENSRNGESRYENQEGRNAYGNYSKVVTGGKAKLILAVTILAIVLIIIGIIGLIAGFISLIAPILVPLLVIALIIRLLGRDR